jgi:hypothetical protein
MMGRLNSRNPEARVLTMAANVFRHDQSLCEIENAAKLRKG